MTRMDHTMNLAVHELGGRRRGLARLAQHSEEIVGATVKMRFLRSLAVQREDVRQGKARVCLDGVPRAEAVPVNADEQAAVVLGRPWTVPFHRFHLCVRVRAWLDEEERPTALT